MTRFEFVLAVLGVASAFGLLMWTLQGMVHRTLRRELLRWKYGAGWYLPGDRYWDGYAAGLKHGAELTRSGNEKVMDVRQEDSINQQQTR